MAPVLRLDTGPHWDFVQTRLPSPISQRVAEIQSRTEPEAVLSEVPLVFENVFRLLLGIVIVRLIDRLATSEENSSNQVLLGEIRDYLTSYFGKTQRTFGELAGHLVRLSAWGDICGAPADELLQCLKTPGPYSETVRKLQKTMKGWPELKDKLKGKPEAGTLLSLTDYLSCFRNKLFHKGFSEITKPERAQIAWRLLLVYLGSLSFFNHVALATYSQKSLTDGTPVFRLVRPGRMSVPFCDGPTAKGNKLLTDHVYLIELWSDPTSCRPVADLDPLFTFVTHEEGGRPCPNCGGRAFASLEGFNRGKPIYQMWACHGTTYPDDLFDRSLVLLQVVRGELSLEDMKQLPSITWQCRESFKEAAAMAYADGVLDDAESTRLEELRQRFGISADEAHRIVEKVKSNENVALAIREKQQARQERVRERFKEAARLAWADGELQDEEDAELNELAEELGIPHGMAEELIAEVASESDIQQRIRAFEKYEKDSHEHLQALAYCLLVSVQIGAPEAADLLQQFENFIRHPHGTRRMSLPEWARCFPELDLNCSEREIQVQRLRDEGRDLRRRGELVSGVVRYALALFLDPTNSTLQRELGIYLFLMKERRGALKMLGAAFAANPFDVTALDYLSDCHMKEENFEAAEWFAAKAAATHPTPDRYVRLARTRKHGAGGIPSAIATCKEGLGSLRSGKKVSTLEELGRLFLQLHRYLVEGNRQKEAEEIAKEFEALTRTPIAGIKIGSLRTGGSHAEG